MHKWIIIEIHFSHCAKINTVRIPPIVTWETLTSNSPDLFKRASAENSKSANQLNSISPPFKQSVSTSEPDFTSISRFESDPVSSQPDFRFTSQNQKIQAKQNGASAICGNFDEVFSRHSNNVATELRFSKWERAVNEISKYHILFQRLRYTCWIKKR